MSSDKESALFDLFFQGAITQETLSRQLVRLESHHQTNPPADALGFWGSTQSQVGTHIP